MRIIRKEVEIARNIVFLCGPYYNSNDSNDRRKILQDYIYNKYTGKYLPLVIDDFLTENNIKDSTINIQLLEEIFAAISYETIIFLDTMSSATELGLFANNGFKNKVYVLLPKTSDILNVSNVGYFVKDIVLKQNTSRIHYDYYRPRIKRKALASDLVVEHYEFINNELPKKVEKELEKTLANDEVIEITYNKIFKLPENNGQINYNYSHDEDKITVFLSIKLFFYLTGVIYSNHYDNFLKQRKPFIANLEMIQKQVYELILNSIKVNTFLPINENTKLILETPLAYDTSEIIRHFEKFMYVYNKDSKLRGLLLIHRPEKIASEESVGVSPNALFNLTFQDIELLSKISSGNAICTDSFSIKNNRKTRKLVKYKETNEGYQLKELHKKVAQELWKKHEPSNSSYAYRKNINILNCVENHKEGRYFLKYDVKNFFNSINREKLIKKLEIILGTTDVYSQQFKLIFDTFFVDGKLPLGLTTSPVLSDIYMNDFDINIVQFSEEKGLIYTRYADDILLSSYFDIGDDLKKEIDDKISFELSKWKLKLNIEKKQHISFTHEGQHLKYIGVNIVYKEDRNVLTVGKKYAYNIAKDFAIYLSMNDSVEKFYFGKKIVGRFSFLNQIEGETGKEKVIERLEKMKIPKKHYRNYMLSIE